MKRILLIKSSLFDGASTSSQLGEELVGEIMANNPGSTLTTLDLAASPIAHLDGDEFSSWTVAPEERNLDQQRKAGVSDRFIEQLLAHDTLVLSVPMYNLGIPSTLKAWIDRVARAGKTFQYTANGPEGLIKDMKAYMVLTRGGQYHGTPLDTQTGYLQGILGLMGISDIETVYAENLARGETEREQSISGARRQIANLTEAGATQAAIAVG